MKLKFLEKINEKNMRTKRSVVTKNNNNTSENEDKLGPVENNKNFNFSVTSKKHAWSGLTSRYNTQHNDVSFDIREIEEIPDLKSSQNQTAFEECEEDDGRMEEEVEPALMKTKKELKSNIMSEKDVIEEVKRYIEKELKSKLKYFYIKAVASRIQQDGNESHWISMFKMECKNIHRKLKNNYIKLYLQNVVPPCRSADLCDLIENRYKSRLKYYLQLRKSELVPKKLCNLLIKSEWLKLRKNVSEKYLCLYYAIRFGPISVL